MSILIFQIRTLMGIELPVRFNYESPVWIQKGKQMSKSSVSQRDSQVKGSGDPDANPSAFDKQSRLALKESESNEIFIAIVGPIGSGTGYVARALKENLVDFDTTIIKASELIKEVAEQNGVDLSKIWNTNSVERVTELQNLGDRTQSG